MAIVLHSPATWGIQTLELVELGGMVVWGRSPGMDLDLMDWAYDNQVGRNGEELVVLDLGQSRGW